MNNLGKIYVAGRQFEIEKNIVDRKAKGVFYTPMQVVEYMTLQTLSKLDIIRNPYVRILDLACGAGYFLLKSFEILKADFEQHLDEILLHHPALRGKLAMENIGAFIVEHNLWGADLDPEAVEFLKKALKEAAGCDSVDHIICADSLLNHEEHPWFWNNEYDCILGNPPYIGHKAVTAQYKAELYKHYKDVYKDKSDISYCFFKRGMELLKENGTLCFITSRYFMEGPSATGLRGFLSSYFIEEIVDFGDSKVFEDAGVSVCIITLRKPAEGICSNFGQHVKVKKPSLIGDKVINLQETPFFEVGEALLKEDGWVLLQQDKLELFQLIEKQSTHCLGDVFESYQGIITGCDKAFVISPTQACEHEIEKDLLRSWVKNSQVSKFFVKTADKQLIYSDDIGDADEYPKAISFITQHQGKLMQRRECQKGVRQWYQLQWGRKKENFERHKLIYPYKAATNRFAVDRQGLYCSADVYSLILKEEYSCWFSLEYIAALLNSKLMEFYFQSYAKKISPWLYDYYPNTVLKMKLKLDPISSKVFELVNLLYNTQSQKEQECILHAIDREIYKMYNLNENQIKLIEDRAGE